MPKAISLFSGAGGIDYGLEAACFRTAVATDVDSKCCETLRRNRLWPVIEGDICEISSQALLRAGGLSVGEADLLAGGPPCQSFSKAGCWARGGSLRLEDPRAVTLREYLRVLEDCQPRAFLLENVEGLSFSGKSEALDLILKRVEEINLKRGTDYRPSFQVVSAADYGVPQLRSRFIMVGLRDGRAFQFPRPGQERRTAWDAIGDVAPSPGEDLRELGKWGSLLPSIPEGQNYPWHTDRGGGEPLFG